MVKKKEVVTSILLALFTCGIYSLIWFISLTDDVKTLTKDESLPSGGVCLLLVIVTCGFYSFYWAYKMGKVIYEAKLRANISSSDNSILYLILQLFGLGLVNYILIQNEINDMVDVINSNQANA